MANTIYAMVQECEHDGDLDQVAKGLRAIGCRIVNRDAYCEGMYETGCITVATDDDLTTLREKAKKHVVERTFDGDTVTVNDLCSLSVHDPSYYR